MARSGIVRHVLVLAFLAVLTLALVQAAPGAVGARQPTGKKKPAAELAGRATILLDNSRLVSIDVADGSVAASVKLAGKPARQRFPGRFLARSSDGERVYVLVNTPGGAPDEIAVLVPGTLELRKTWALADGVVYRGIAVGPVSGRVYAYGNTPGAVVDEATGQREQSVVLTVLDPATPKKAQTTTIRKGAKRDWWAFWGAVTPDEKRFYVSYHGGCAASNVALCTTGADWVAIDGDELRRCPAAKGKGKGGVGSGCLEEAHGVLEPMGKLIYATTGGSDLVVADRRNKVVERLDTKIDDTHLMSFALDRKRAEAVLVSCDNDPGVSIVDLETGKAKRVAKKAPCASMLGYVPGRSLVALASRSNEIESAEPTLTLLDVGSGKSLLRKTLGAEPLDLSLEIERRG